MSPEPTTLTLRWTPRASEMADAALARNRDVGGSGSRAVLAMVIALLGAATLTQRSTVSLGAAALTVAAILAFFRVTAPLQRRRWGALVAANPTLGETCAMTFDADGMHLVSDRVRSSRRWDGFSSWSQAPEAVVVATSDTALGHVVVVPHRAAGSDEELATLRALLSEHLGPALGSGPGRAGRAWLTWVARAVVVVCLALPVGAALARNHAQGGEWALWPSEAPPLLTHDGVEYRREGGPTGRPTGVAGIDYTRGGGLVLVPFPADAAGPAPQLWVLDHRGVVRHYLAG